MDRAVRFPNTPLRSPILYKTLLHARSAVFPLLANMADEAKKSIIRQFRIDNNLKDRGPIPEALKPSLQQLLREEGYTGGQMEPQASDEQGGSGDESGDGDSEGGDEQGGSGSAEQEGGSGDEEAWGDDEETDGDGAEEVGHAQC